MKKYFLICLCCGLVTTNSLASGIASNTNSAPCTNNTLETYSGNSNLSADWQPNEIQLRWYNMNTQITPTNTTANTCVYDGSLAIPQNAPTRTGYTFAGWEVIPQYDFSTLPAETRGTGAWSKVNPGGACWYGQNGTRPAPCDNGEFDDLNYYEWKTSFDYGTIYGFGLCSSTIGETHKAGTPSESNGGYCWCKVTGFVPINSNTKHSPAKNTNWVYNRPFDTYDYCTYACVDYCSAAAISSAALRQAMFN